MFVFLALDLEKKNKDVMIYKLLSLMRWRVVKYLHFMPLRDLLFRGSVSAFRSLFKVCLQNDFCCTEAAQ